MTDQPKFGSSYVEPKLELLSEGKVLDEVDSALQRMMKDLVAYVESSQDPKAKATLTLRITVQPFNEHVLDQFTIEPDVTTRSPKRRIQTDVGGMAGERFVLPLGHRARGRGQLTLFDEAGQAKGLLDQSTGEVVE